jgi:hypothetical protein
MQRCMKFYPFILFNKFFVFVNFCYGLIFINKFIKHNHINDPYYDIKYPDLYPSLNFFQFFLLLLLTIFFIYINNYWFILLDTCMSFFIYTLTFLRKQPAYPGLFLQENFITRGSNS